MEGKDEGHRRYVVLDLCVRILSGPTHIYINMSCRIFP